MSSASIDADVGYGVDVLGGLLTPCARLTLLERPHMAHHRALPAGERLAMGLEASPRKPARSHGHSRRVGCSEK